MDHEQQQHEEQPEVPTYHKYSLRDAIVRRRPLPAVRSIVEGRPRSVREMGPRHSAARYYSGCHATKNRFPLAVALLWLNSHTSSEATDCADVALYLLECWPEAATKADLNGVFPIHLVSPNWPIELVRRVVEASAGPKLLRRLRPSRGGNEEVRIPLHCAVAEGCGSETIRVMVEAFPESVRIADNKGQVALHHASGNGCDPDLVEYLLQQWPDAIYIADNNGMLPLHRACIRRRGRKREAGILRLVQAWSDALQYHDNRGRLPLHCFVASCSRGCERCLPGSSLEQLQLERARSEVQWLMVRFLVDTYPESVRAQDSEGSVPLHDAVRHQSVEVPRLLLEEWPEAVRHANCDGSLPIHGAAAAAVARVEMVQLLVHTWPDSVQHRDKTGSLPLHRVFDRQTQRYRDANPDNLLPTTRLLVQTWPDAVRQRDNRGMLPLHRAVDQDAKGGADPVPIGELVRLLVQTWPDSVRQTDDEGYLPLHRALTRTSSWADHVSFLVEQWPESVHEWTAALTDGTRFLPLHLAVQQNDRRLVKRFVVRWPESVRERCPGHGFPLHMVFRHPVPNLHVARGLIREWPGSLLERDDNRCLPLHLAVRTSQRHVPPDFVRHMVQMGPGSVRERDDRGCLPIHAAFSRAQWSGEVAQILLEEWPESIRERDGEGRLPLHLAASKRIKPVDPVRRLVEAWPQAVRERDALGRLPLHASLQPFRESSVPCLLVHEWPGSVRERDSEGRLPLHLALDMRDITLDVVQALVEPWPDSARERDSLGRLPLHVVLDKIHVDPCVAKLLAECWPQAAMEVGANRLYPLQLAAMKNADLELLFVLAKLCPDLFFRG
jgi:ankyrin repeat protein